MFRSKLLDSIETKELKVARLPAAFEVHRCCKTCSELTVDLNETPSCC